MTIASMDTPDKRERLCPDPSSFVSPPTSHERHWQRPQEFIIFGFHPS